MTQDDTGRPRMPARPALVPAIRRPAAGLGVLGLPALAVPAVVFGGDTGPSRLDTRIRTTVLEKAPAGSWDLIRGIDWLGEPIGRALLLIAVTLICWRAGRRALAATAVVGMVAVTVLATALKPVVGRRIHAGFLSYPSGHTAALTAAALIVAFLLADLLDLGPIAGTAVVLAVTLAAAGLTSWAQIILDAHYATDTVGGFGLALVVVPATAAVVGAIGRRLPARAPGR
ncbi:phosphatase PAP2 family protein [Kribbella turkmenica]|uniref:Phosphatase PAP2 family protein n=1 Tax=Kribbella turkmenica TaxID=2530375 RepID=A0A4R4WU38_9ACTN|nr:phosphatase PAP2 family protein [Kribbella turkmenica]TDD21209.1 phosphatase PAP2 family protein [Kribbella turkmenica]